MKRTVAGTVSKLGRMMSTKDDVPETIIVSSKHYPSGNDRKKMDGRTVGDRMPSETATDQQSSKKMGGDTLLKTVILRPVSKKRGEGSDD